MKLFYALNNFYMIIKTLPVNQLDTNSTKIKSRNLNYSTFKVIFSQTRKFNRRKVKIPC